MTITAVIESGTVITAKILPRGAAGWIVNSEIDGGRSDSLYTDSQIIDGGDSASTFTAPVPAVDS